MLVFQRAIEKERERKRRQREIKWKEASGRSPITNIIASQNTEILYRFNSHDMKNQIDHDLFLNILKLTTIIIEYWWEIREMFDEDKYWIYASLESGLRKFRIYSIWQHIAKVDLQFLTKWISNLHWEYIFAHNFYENCS